jgi:ATP phosphoribosyltransferase
VVATGKTLEENGLRIVEVITDSAARLVVNRASYQLKAEALGQFIKSLEDTLRRRASDD